MTRHSIEIPEPVITVEVVADYPDDYNWRAGHKITATIDVGGVTVFERVYQTGPDARDSAGFYPDSYAHDEDDARDKVLKAFGEKLKEVLQ